MSDEPETTSKERSWVGNVVGGFVAGLYSVPEGIGYASLAGVSPMFGIYSGMVPVAMAAATTGSILMMSTLTSAIALTMAGVLDSASYTSAQVPQAVFTMTLLAGLIMFLLGALKLGRVVTFVSNAVMTGFVTGVAILIMVGKMDDIFGYDPSGFSNKVVKGLDILFHPGRWDMTTTAVGLSTIALAFLLKAIPKLERYALVIVVVLGTAVVWIFNIDTTTISSTATIATGWSAIPIPDSTSVLPDLSMVPTLLLGSFSIAIVALAQGAGIRPAFPNPDGSKSDSSRDFLGQGLGNIAGSFFQSTPSGGSLSRTAVSAEGGATRRSAGYVAALSVLVLVVAFGSVVGHIPEAVIGGLLFVIGVELVKGRMPDARLAWRTGMQSRLLLVITLVFTLTLKLQWAILLGALLSLFEFIGASSKQVGLRQFVRDDEGWLAKDDVPTTLSADAPVLVRYTGPNFFAVVSTLMEELPSPNPDGPGVLILDLGVQQHYSSTMLKALERYVDDLNRAGNAMVFVVMGDDTATRQTFDRVGLLQRIGDANVMTADPHIDVALEAAMDRGEARLAELRAASA